MRRLSILAAVVLFPGLLAYCKEAEFAEPLAGSESAQTGGSSSSSSSGGVTAADADEDVVAYAELCKQELEITQPLPAMSCLNGTEVPITVNGQPLDADNYARLGETGCDNPQWLGSSCHNYDFVQKIDVGNPDVDAVLNCRQKYFTNHKHKDARRDDFVNASDADKVERYKDLAEFDDLGFILRNKRSGKSCFFTVFSQRFNGAYLPPPDQRTLPSKESVRARLETTPPDAYPESSWYRNGTDAWFTPQRTAGGGCVGCHDIGAFKHSPFIDQVDVVPTNRTVSKRMPYLLVGNVFQQAFRSRNLIDVTTDPVDGQSQRCTSCHRMTAGGENCNRFMDWSTGHDPSPRSESAKQWPQAAWMPEDHDLASQEQFTARWGKHIDRMKCCCAKPNARGCSTRAFGPTLDALGTLPAGAALPELTPAAADATESCLDAP